MRYQPPLVTFLKSFLAVHFINSVAALNPPVLVFDCSVTPGACTTMCWGAFCAGFGEALSFDKPSQQIKDARRNKAGCGAGNRCCDESPDPEGSSCDEYPFASSIEADHVQQVNRCIKPSENSSTFCHFNNRLSLRTMILQLMIAPLPLGQGGSLSSFIQHKLNNAQGEYSIAFANPDNDATQYCEHTTECLNDGNMFEGENIAPDGHAHRTMHKRHYYMLESNTTVLSGRELDLLTPVKRAEKRSRVEMNLLKRSGGDQFELVDDTIISRIIP